MVWTGVWFDSHFSGRQRDRKSTRLNSSHVANSYAVFCLKKKNMIEQWRLPAQHSVKLHMQRRTGYPLLAAQHMCNAHQVIIDVFFFNDTATTEIYTLSLHDALPIASKPADVGVLRVQAALSRIAPIA